MHRLRGTVGDVAVALLAVGLLPACASRVPDPRDAARAYAEAAERGDADAILAMTTAASRRAAGDEALKARIADERAELADQGRELARADLRVEAAARLRYADGEEAALDLRAGQYRVTAAGTIPGGGRTPGEALDQLRRALARRSYGALMRVLSPTTREAVEGDLRRLVEGLDEPRALPVEVSGDAALVKVPGGHQVKLRRDGGVWRVEDFD